MLDFIDILEREGELVRIKAPVDPVLEITEITDRVHKAGGRALLFENTGTDFPVLTNIFGTERRLELALGRLTDVRARIERLLSGAMSPAEGLWGKLRKLPMLAEISRYMPRKVRGRGICQRVVMWREGDDFAQALTKLPILKCWPHDGGRFITLPLVHTVDPVSKARNVGMYRMQVVDSATTGMHWHVHKTGAKHYREWQNASLLTPNSSLHKMPVTVCLGGDPTYTYAATAPMPEGMDEYLLAGFLRRRAVRLVQCITNELFVPEDCDFVIEGYVDTAEPKFMEGPFGDHTGFYSLEDFYAAFHVTMITHRPNAVYPATIVGIPPQEDFQIARATENIFAIPMRLVYPEVTDLKMPAAGVAHNLALVSIAAEWPGQAFKTAAAMWGAGQMMFNKVLVVLPEGVSLDDRTEIARRMRNLDVRTDILMGRGILDILDHATSTLGLGGKIALDLTVRRSEELGARSEELWGEWGAAVLYGADEVDWDAVQGVNFVVLVDAAARNLTEEELLWHVLANIDPARDITIHDCSLLIDGRTKSPKVTKNSTLHTPHSTLPERTPNVVVSSPETIALVDRRWAEYGLGAPLPSPSRHFQSLVYSDSAEV